ncbi:hypothetical protein FHW83_004717 [Duganella sp. SG902]|uniref:hypothetical protein n=1 Tax=Duganella sp. SG902 TaxID=2587016 RepID=UPI00159E98A4|nr:hypothetical protein [Duganella sp. SG902]NVM78886.1 hypothetical protein [Duganella sp. SG902]
MSEAPVVSRGIPGLVGIAVAAAWLVGCLVGYAAHTWTHESVKDQLATHQVNDARADAATAEAGRVRLKEAVTRANKLEKALAESETQYRKLAQEQRNALKSHTTGRVCLDAGAVRVLNATATTPGDASHGLPDADVHAAATSSAAAADPDVEESGAEATDDDVAGWAVTVKEQYGVCRSRLQRLIDWFAPVIPEQSPTNATTHD